MFYLQAGTPALAAFNKGEPGPSSFEAALMLVKAMEQNLMGF